MKNGSIVKVFVSQHTDPKTPTMVQKAPYMFPYEKGVGMPRRTNVKATKFPFTCHDLPTHIMRGALACPI